MDYKESLELAKQLETDSCGNPVFWHFNDKFFPFEGRGFGAEGQRDCYTYECAKKLWVCLVHVVCTHSYRILYVKFICCQPLKDGDAVIETLKTKLQYLRVC